MTNHPSPLTPTDEAAIVDFALTSRRSVRAFLPTPIARAEVEALLQVAARAPSGTNIQPWKVHVVQGAKRDELVKAVQHAHYTEPQNHQTEYAYYPTKWREPYLGRRRKIGWDMYGLLGIGKADKDKMHQQHGDNYGFFGAPVGLMFTVDADMEKGSWLDSGMFLQNIMTAARGRGLHTCPQQAWSSYYKIVKPLLGIPESETLMCGMALGYEDANAPINRLVTVREPLDAFAQFHWSD